MAKSITTSIVIEFTNPELADDGHLSAEVDNRDDGFNQGRTQFFYGDTPAFLVFASSNVSYTIEPTDGSVSSLGTGTIEVDEIISFTDETESNLSKPPSGAVTFTVLNGRGIASVNDFQVVGTKVIVPEKALANVRCKYQAAFSAFMLSGVSDPGIADLEAYPVLIYILGTIG